MGFDFSEEADLTNKELAEELAKLTPLTTAEIEALLPRKADKEKFTKLLQIVGKAEADNKKAAALIDNVEELGVVTVKVLGKLLKFV